MRISTAYLAGAGTAIVAVIIGVSGGWVIANMIHPPKPVAEMTKLERRMSSEPIPANGPSEPAPQLAVTRAAATSPAVVPSASPAPPQQVQPEPVDTASPAASNSEPPQQVPQAPVQAQAASPEDAFAKASEVEEKREARRAAAEKRRAERRQRWAERRRNQQRQEDTLRDVEQKVRQETEGPRLFASEPAAMEPGRMEMPRIRLFADDD